MEVKDYWPIGGEEGIEISTGKPMGMLIGFGESEQLHNIDHSDL